MLLRNAIIVQLHTPIALDNTNPSLLRILKSHSHILHHVMCTYIVTSNYCKFIFKPIFGLPKNRLISPVLRDTHDFPLVN